MDRIVLTFPVKFMPNNKSAVIIMETIGPETKVGISGSKTLKYPAKPKLTAPAEKENERKYKPEH